MRRPSRRSLVRWCRCPGCTSGFNLFAQAEFDEEMAELGRLLYVAATRAADYLVFSSGLEGLDRSGGPWLELLRRQFDLETGAVAGNPQRVLAKVIREEPPLVKDLAGRAAASRSTEDNRQGPQTRGLRQGPASPYLPPVPVDLAARRHYSFSRLHGSLHRRELSQPMQGPGLQEDATPPLDPLGLGTLVHAVLADLANGADDTRRTIESLVRRHAGLHLPDSGDRLDEPIDLIARLAASPRWAAVRAASRVHAEMEFLLAWPPGNHSPEAPYLQGFIDCLYQDGGGDWRLLDYKTNRVSPETLASTVETYEMQMFVYAQAVERVLKRPPVEVILCFLREGREHSFQWDAAAGRRLIELVQSAMRR